MSFFIVVVIDDVSMIVLFVFTIVANFMIAVVVIVVVAVAVAVVVVVVFVAVIAVSGGVVALEIDYLIDVVKVLVVIDVDDEVCLWCFCIFCGR